MSLALRKVTLEGNLCRDVQHNVHIVKLAIGDPAEGAKAVLQTTMHLEDNVQLAQAIADNSQRFVEHILSVDNVQRHVTHQFAPQDD